MTAFLVNLQFRTDHSAKVKAGRDRSSPVRTKMAVPRSDESNIERMHHVYRCQERLSVAERKLMYAPAIKKKVYLSTER